MDNVNVAAIVFYLVSFVSLVTGNDVLTRGNTSHTIFDHTGYANSIRPSFTIRLSSRSSPGMSRTAIPVTTVPATISSAASAVSPTTLSIHMSSSDMANLETLQTPVSVTNSIISSTRSNIPVHVDTTRSIHTANNTSVFSETYSILPELPVSQTVVETLSTTAPTSSIGQSVHISLSQPSKANSITISPTTTGSLPPQTSLHTVSITSTQQVHSAISNSSLNVSDSDSNSSTTAMSTVVNETQTSATGMLSKIVCSTEHSVFDSLHVTLMSSDRTLQPTTTHRYPTATHVSLSSLTFTSSNTIPASSIGYTTVHAASNTSAASKFTSFISIYTSGSYTLASTIYNPLSEHKSVNLQSLHITNTKSTSATTTSRVSLTSFSNVPTLVTPVTSTTEASLSVGGIITSSITHALSDISTTVTENINMTGSSTTIPESESTTTFLPIRIKITFEGNCNKLRYSVQLQMEFWQSLLSVIALATNNTMLRLSTSDLKPYDMGCHPFFVVFVVKNILYQNLLNIINGSIFNAHFTVPILDEMTLVEYNAISVHDVTHIETHGNYDVVHPELKHVDVVVMVIAAVLFALMLCLGAIICCRECYKRKRAATFNLLDVPPVNIKFDDCALSRMPRSQTIYHGPSASSRNVYTSKSNGRPPHIPLIEFTSKRKPATTEAARDQLPVHAGDIHVRTCPLAGGLMVGVTCTPPSSPMNDHLTSGSNSSGSDGDDQTTKRLLGNENGGHGTSNPNFRTDGGHERLSGMYLIQEDETEEFL